MIDYQSKYNEIVTDNRANSPISNKIVTLTLEQYYDLLHHTHKISDIIGGTTAEACWGYLTKHLVALRDMVKRNDFSNREDFLEKCQDSINYIRFLWCIGNEEMDKYTREACEFEEKENE